MKTFKMLVEQSNKPSVPVTNPGNFVNEGGKKYYLKTSPSKEHAENEVLASKLYQAIGVPTVDYQLHHFGSGNYGVKSEVIPDVRHINVRDVNDRREVQQHFGAHALLANWDSIGMHQANHLFDKSGKAHVIDFGSAVAFRGSGPLKGKLFTDHVGEFDSLRDLDGHGYESAVAYHDIEPHTLVDSARRATSLHPDKIADIVEKHGPSNPELKKTITQKLLARRQDLIGRANQVASQHGLEPINHTY